MLPAEQLLIGLEVTCLLTSLINFYWSIREFCGIVNGQKIVLDLVDHPSPA